MNELFKAMKENEFVCFFVVFGMCYAVRIIVETIFLFKRRPK